MSNDSPLPSAEPPFSHPIVVAELRGRKPTRFELIPDEADLEKIAEDLGLRGLRKVRFTGQLAPLGKTDWSLDARLGATVVQDCVVTLDPVTTRLEEVVDRRWVADLPDPDPAEEVEMSEDDSIDPLGPVIDLGHVLCESLALALPLYPRSEGADAAELTAQVFAAPDVAPMTDEDAKPFAGLAALRDQLGAETAGKNKDEDEK